MRVGGLGSVRLRAGSRKGIRRGRRGGTGFLEDWFEGGGGGGRLRKQGRSIFKEHQ